MYFCIQIYATYFREQSRNFSSFLQTILGGRDGNSILLVFCTHQVLCHIGELHHCVKELVPNNSVPFLTNEN